MKSKMKVTCRPCKEKDNWEIETPDGEVLKNIILLARNV